ncbi:response regulator transcription factor [Candidatus Nitrosarchaeum limnium]|uniref:Response regulator receiver domain protein n=1 Tax=Candidatus Nitrosarchaeum limnium BG20 TaxID=859192 RepID=S2E439_9ARCH|nr:response regulator transcription factor [Candidatus Nitrosarchaeum limnium]EPA05990.1 response regulator receiver domain protein [Candidatus Nitrosarchaeum limnium BG20]
MGRQYPVVLIIDDSPAFRDFAKYSIRTDIKFVNIFQAADAIEGLKLYKKYKPDVVLLDWKMPGIDGMSTLKAIITNDPDVKVIMTTAYDDNQNLLNDFMKFGAFSFVPKPMNRINLLKVVADALRERKNAKFYGQLHNIAKPT